MTSSGRGNPTVPFRAERSSSGDSNGARRVTVEFCRKQLGSGCRLTDSELEALLDNLYALANVCVDAFVEKTRGEQKLRVSDVIAPAASAIELSTEAQ